MGCLFQCLDPGPPDESVRHFWHIRGVIIDSSAAPSSSSSSAGRQQHSPSTDTLHVDRDQQLKKQSSTNGGDQCTAPRKRAVALEKVQRLPAGVLYVYEGCLVYRERRWARRCLWRREQDQLEIALCEIADVNVPEQFVSQRDNKPIRCAGPLVDVVVSASRASSKLHLGFITDSAHLVGKELRETFQRHRQRPRIFQFNSVDIEGVEIDVP